MIHKPQRFPIWGIVVTDIVVVSFSVFLIQYFWRTEGAVVLNILSLTGQVMPTYTTISLGIIALWVFALGSSGSWRYRILGSGSAEYSLVARASATTFVLVGLFSYLFKAEIARGYLLLAFPIGLFLLLISRWSWRQFITRSRKKEAYLQTAVIVGSIKSSAEVAKVLAEHSEAGLKVVGAFLPSHTIPESQSQQLSLEETGTPIWGGVDDIIPSIRKLRIDSVIVANSDSLKPQDVRKLGWQLLPSRENLYLAANILDIAGPRLSIQPVAGLPLIRIDQPQFTLVNRAIKRIIDLFLALIGLILLSPVLLVAAWQIHHFDKGPVFFTQERIGKKGKPFAMFKLRTMRIGAADELNSLDVDKEKVAGNTVLFKLKDDPRITKPGRWLRKYSVDEVPQLLNVLIGNMSIVGPRPPLQQEVDQYDEFVTSRFIVKPGLTGLWQISGRSELDWEESIRADLNYVQNWSIMFDLVIIWRTIKTVLSGKGAY